MNIGQILQQELTHGLTLLMAAGLPGRPGQYAKSQEEAQVAMQAAARAWFLAIEGQYKTLILHPRRIKDEIDRIREGFHRLLKTSKRWPAPADLLEALPQRREPEYLPLPLASDEQYQTGLRAIQKIKKFLYH